MKTKADRRKHRVSTKVKAVSTRPRLHVYRSNQHVYAQIIDPKDGKILATANDLKTGKSTKAEKAQKVGEAIAKAASAAKIKAVVFDRGAYKYHGRVKAVAEAARKAGLTI